MPLGRFFAIANLLLTASAASALAQTPPPQSSAAPAKPPAQAAAPAGTAAVVLDLNAIDGVLGKSVKSYKGEDMGHVVDVLVTLNGQTRAAVIDFGGVLGVGSRKVAVDWKTLSFASGPKGPIVLALTRDQVRVAPEYKTGDPVVVLELSPSEPAAPKPPPKPDSAKK